MKMTREVTVEMVQEFFNCNVAEIDAQGDIWIAEPMTGHWLKPEEKEKLIAWAKSLR
jgi:hypothetical protein